MSTLPSSLPPKKRPVADAADADAATARAAANANADATAADAAPPPPAATNDEAKPRVTIDPLNLLGTHEPRDRFGDPLPPRPAKEPRLADAEDAEGDEGDGTDDNDDSDAEEPAADPPTTSAGIAAARRTGKIHGLVAEYRAPRIGAQFQATLPPLLATAAAPPPPNPQPQAD